MAPHSRRKRSAILPSLFCCGCKSLYSTDQARSKELAAKPIERVQKAPITPKPTKSDTEPARSKATPTKKTVDPLRQPVAKSPAKVQTDTGSKVQGAGAKMSPVVAQTTKGEQVKVSSSTSAEVQSVKQKVPAQSEKVTKTVSQSAGKSSSPIKESVTQVSRDAPTKSAPATLKAQTKSSPTLEADQGEQSQKQKSPTPVKPVKQAKAEKKEQMKGEETVTLSQESTSSQSRASSKSAQKSPTKSSGHSTSAVSTTPTEEKMEITEAFSQESTQVQRGEQQSRRSPPRKTQESTQHTDQSVSEKKSPVKSSSGNKSEKSDPPKQVEVESAVKVASKKAPEPVAATEQQTRSKSPKSKVQEKPSSQADKSGDQQKKEKKSPDRASLKRRSTSSRESLEDTEVTSTSGVWTEEAREVSPEVERFLSVSQTEIPTEMSMESGDVITPQTVPTTQSAAPASGSWTVESQASSASLHSEVSGDSMTTETNVLTMEISDPVTEQMTSEYSSVSESHLTVAGGAVLTPPETGTKTKRKKPVEEVMEYESSVMTHSSSTSSFDIPDSSDIMDPPLDEEESGSGSGGSVEYSRTQLTETEEIIETEVEETVTMVIVGVVRNPGQEPEQVLSLQDAVNMGILDLSQGVYYNTDTKQHISMMEAMNNGWIKMGQAKVEKSEEKVKSMGIVTIRTTRETMPYTVRAAMNTQTGQMLSLDQAADLHILDPVHGVFTDLKAKTKMLIGDAVDQKLVEIEYDNAATGTVQEEVLKTYSVHAVIDQRNRKKLLFHEAVAAGIIDKSTGEYIHNITWEKIPAEQAIERGFVKATLTDNPRELSLDQIGNKTAQRGTDAIRKKLLNPLKALKSLKK